MVPTSQPVSLPLSQRLICNNRNPQTSQLRKNEFNFIVTIYQENFKRKFIKKILHSFQILYVRISWYIISKIDLQNFRQKSYINHSAQNTQQIIQVFECTGCKAEGIGTRCFGLITRQEPSHLGPRPRCHVSTFLRRSQLSKPHNPCKFYVGHIKTKSLLLASFAAISSVMLLYFVPIDQDWVWAIYYFIGGSLSLSLHT